MVNDLYYQSRAAHSHQSPKKGALVNLFLKISESNQMTLVIDALDECDDERRKEFLQDLITLRHRSSKIRIITTSREVPDIKQAFECLNSLTIHGDAQTKDIQLYLTKRLEAVELSRLCRDDEKENIISTILRKADGMSVMPKGSEKFHGTDEALS
jgi:hypothetical protein